MKTLALTWILLCTTFSIYAQTENDYETAVSRANYAYSHAKNAHESNNRDHVIEHSDKAIEAFYEVEELADKCGCEDAYNAAIDGREASEKTASQDTWERSRFYAKRARAYGKEMVSLLNDCTPLGQSNTAYVNNDTATQTDIEAQRAELLEKQQILIKEQKRLEAQIVIQKQKQAEFEAQLQRLADL